MSQFEEIKESIETAKWEMTDIYKKEDRFKNPKYVFGVIDKMITEHFPGKEDLKLLDVGAAEGAFPYYVLSQHPGYDVYGLEYDEELVKLAEKQVPECDWRQGDANDLSHYDTNSLDTTTCIGVLSIFDDYRPCVEELLRVTRPGGLVIINNFWNAFPVDLIIRTRHAKPGPQTDYTDWQAGWNMISIATISAFLEHHDKVEDFDFTDVVLPFDLPQRPENPLRTWTNIDASGNRYHMNGIGRVIDKKILRIRLKG